MSDYITFELQAQIMLRLPVKSLMQFRSVSKAWKSLIDSSDFNAAQSVCRTQRQHLLVSCNDPVTKEKNYVSFVDDDSFPHQKSAPTLPLSVKLLSNSRIIASSHGLLCLHGYYQSSVRSHLFDHGKEMAVLWNPSIRKSIAIALPEVCCIGFGVCPVTSDPMIVTMRCDCWKVEVYKLSSRKWRSLSSNIPSNSIVVARNQVVIDGFMYWFAMDTGSINVGHRSLILSFDMTNECFSVIDLPQSLSFHNSMTLSISKLRESLVMLELQYSIYTKKQDCVVWMMEEYGVQKSFTKLFTIKTPNASIWRTLGFRKHGQPIIETKDDNANLYEPRTTTLAVYEPNSENINIDLWIHGGDLNFCVNSYMETLLLFNQ